MWIPLSNKFQNFFFFFLRKHIAILSSKKKKKKMGTDVRVKQAMLNDLIECIGVEKHSNSSKKRANVTLGDDVGIKANDRATNVLARTSQIQNATNHDLQEIDDNNTKERKGIQNRQIRSVSAFVVNKTNDEHRTTNNEKTEFQNKKIGGYKRVFPFNSATQKANQLLTKETNHKIDPFAHFNRIVVTELKKKKK
ncbi:hypothetical protein RFI_11581 [Reticulomyxa filosa]|uniref:Uncharacterized protein n=1 Tax=Reticulomyxa filosa TaxID=46433 RepID=X6NIK5_RETFI|nr:hypothetical protein RFI_11581 [Reticulomyxa filosa]|eukprot:ETO25554.1 hypothetical protein RFI_11581 [Reticulomyxa filosa]